MKIFRWTFGYDPNCLRLFFEISRVLKINSIFRCRKVYFLLFLSRENITFRLYPHCLNCTHNTTLPILLLLPLFGFSAFPTFHPDSRQRTEIRARHAIVYIVAHETNGNVENADCRSSRGPISNESKIVFTNPLALNVITEVQLAFRRIAFLLKSAFAQHLSSGERKFPERKAEAFGEWKRESSVVKAGTQLDNFLLFWFTFNTNTSALY